MIAGYSYTAEICFLTKKLHMKKNLLFSAILLMTIISVNAQITITRQDFPVIGNLVISAMDNTTIIDPGSPGLNKTWDFSNLTASGYDSVYYTGTWGMPNAQNYPDANIVSNHNPDDYPGGYNINYWNFSDGAIKGVGDESLINIWSTLFMALHMKYTPAAIQIPLPFTYGNSNNQTFVLDWITTFRSGGVTSDSSRTIRHTTMNLLADASGTMILPDGNFPVLRVKEMWSSVDSGFTWSGSAWVYDSDTLCTFTQYRWYANEFGEVGFYSTNAKKANGFTFFKSEQLVGIGEHGEKMQCSIYPNPATSVVNIKTNEVIGLAEVIDNTGKTVMEFNGQSGIDISALPAGNYLIRVHSGNKVMSGKITKL